MHELGVVFHIIRRVEELGQENELQKVNRVTVEVGEVSAVIPSYLTDCWNWAVKKSELLSGAQLEVETIPAVTWCDDCRTTYPTVAHGKTCPYCGGGNTWLQQGNEFNLKEIEAS